MTYTRGQEFTSTTSFCVEACCVCGCLFGLPKEMEQRRLNDHKSFYCPNGHSQHYSGKSKAEKLQEEVEVQKQNARYWQERTADEKKAKEAERRKLSAAKGVITRTKNRIKNGVCPCCNRSFVSLAKHMKTMHPDYVRS